MSRAVGHDGVIGPAGAGVAGMATAGAWTATPGPAAGASARRGIVLRSGDHSRPTAKIFVAFDCSELYRLFQDIDFT